MNGLFVDSEVDRTKSKWVTNVFKEFGRPKTTLRALFYFALQRSTPDYPICGGFVGEIRIMRPYHYSDGQKLAKWVDRARKLGYLPQDSILEELPGECVLAPGPSNQRFNQGCRANLCLELWLNRSAFNPLLHPVCTKHAATLVSVGPKNSRSAIEKLYERCQNPTLILCLSDLSSNSFSFCQDLFALISESKRRQEKKILIKHLGLTPNQVVDLNIPMVPGEKGEKHAREMYKKYLKPYGLDYRMMAELDALEVACPRGIAGFVDLELSKYSDSLDAEFADSL